MLANVKGKDKVNFFWKNITNAGHKNLANKKPPIKTVLLNIRIDSRLYFFATVVQQFIKKLVFFSVKLKIKMPV